MNAIERFSERALDYSRYRWDYAPKAIDAVIDVCGLSFESSVADIGSGSGMLARQFAVRVRSVIAIEPSAEMRAIAQRQLPENVRIVDAFADATTLPDSSINMITIGRALHWFPATAARAEFRRILKADGWLSIFKIPCTDKKLVDAIQQVRSDENGWDATNEDVRANMPPLTFFFGNEHFRSLSFPVVVHETWDEFLGRISSLSPAPRADHPARQRFEKSLREVFNAFAEGEILVVPTATEVTFGHMAANFPKDAQ